MPERVSTAVTSGFTTGDGDGHGSLTYHEVTLSNPFRVDALSRVTARGALIPQDGVYGSAGRLSFIGYRGQWETTAEPKLQEYAEVEAFPAIAQARGAGARLARPVGPPPGTDEGIGGLTFHGITFYGNIDIGAQHQTHGATYNSNAPQTGLEQTINKNSNHALTHYSQNGLSQSVLGVRGNKRIFSGVSGIFKLEPGVEPLDFRFTNSIQSLVGNNGVPVQNQSANFDTNRSGRIDNGEAYFGLTASRQDKAQTATLIFGRVVSTMGDNVSKYDFNSGSYAFSLISYVGQVSGGGDSEDYRLDGTLKFTSQIGRFRVGALNQFSGHNRVFQPDGVYGSNRQLMLGGDYRGLSVDVIYAGVRDAISAASLTAAQVLTLPKNSLAGTISDNSAYAVMGKYSIDKAGRAKLYAGFDRIRYSNPLHPLSPGISDIGGYILSVLTQNTYTPNKILHAYWGGGKYSFTPKLDVSGGFYSFRQNSYSGNGCTDNSNVKCSGNLNVVSGVAAYKITRLFSVYGGGEWSDVTNGSSSGFLYTNDVTATIGARFRF